MIFRPISRIAIILFIALILVQGAQAITLEQAPLNPAFVAYTEGLDTIDSVHSSISRSFSRSEDAHSTYVTDPPYTLGLIPAPGVIVWPDQYTETAQRSRGSLPSRFDLRDESRVTPVLDQGDCGSCWAFAAYGSLESTYLTDTGTAEDFSENNMRNLCSNLYPDGFDLGPCDGGNTYMSAAYLTRGSGPIREEDDTYILPVPSDMSPIDKPPVLDTHEITFLPTRTGPLENDLLKQTLMDEGAIRIGFNINWSCFADNYTTYYRPDTGYPSLGGHAVTLVGWDDDFSNESFAVHPPGNGAFILKNSWGTNDGEEGYFYISYYDRSLDKGEPAVFTGVPADRDRRIYQYDPLGTMTGIGTGSTTTCYGANVFTAESYEGLTDVSFYTWEPEVEYTVSIFTNFTTPPGDNAPVTWTSGTCALPGYHTVSLSNSVPLMQGEMFSVVIKISSPNDVYPLAVEKPIPNYSSNATASAGESYVSGDGEVWEDLTIAFPNTNVCIKAFTHPLTVVPDNYSTIQAAIDAATSGDTIIVKAGTYPEELILNKIVTLLGEGMPVITTPENKTGVEINADNCTLSGFFFDGEQKGKDGIEIEGNYTTLSDIEISGYEYGITIYDVQGLSLSTTAIHDNTYNFLYWDTLEAPGNTIDETVTVNGRPVVYREGASGVSIDASTNAGAVICVNCTDISIRDTTTESIGDGIALLFCHDAMIQNVTADKILDYGVWTYASENITVQESRFGPDILYGVFADETNGLRVTDNYFVYEHGVGVSHVNGSGSIITNNIMNGDEESWSVWELGTSEAVVTGNTIEGGMKYGITLINADTLTVSDNTLDVTGYGIMIKNGEMATVSGNTVQCNGRGTGMEITADGAEITGNIIDNCSKQALMILNNSVVQGNFFSGTTYPKIYLPEQGRDVSLYRNDFILMPGEPYEENNGVSWHDTSAEVENPTNTFSMMPEPHDSRIWHSPTEETYWYNGNAFTAFLGNYWSTYNGTDTTHDGIGETPFTIYGNETDIRPLMKPFAWYLNKNPNISGGSDGSAGMATSSALSAGGRATLHFTGSAVQQVMITAAEGTGRFLLTVNPSPSGPEGLTGQVYQYITVELTGMSADQISEAEFAFHIPAAWLRAEGITPAHISLWRFHDGVWQELPTSVMKEEGGWVSFTATTPGFSSFAIAEGTGNFSVTQAPVVENRTETTDIEITVTTEPEVTAVPEEEKTTPTESATPPQKSPMGFVTVIGGAAGVVLICRRW
ncbi:MAG: PGF-pre-PGF domain-containing protein [Methanomicrobiales archaeon]|nr:PGF-pre-PGF domain-containing protein [Methanomicrobiales archaeon]